jgi:hypothetical protein
MPLVAHLLVSPRVQRAFAKRFLNRQVLADRRRGLRRFPDQPAQQAPHLLEGDLVIHRDRVAGVERHVGEQRVPGVLDHGHPAAALDRQQPGRAIVLVPGQDHPDPARAVGERRRAEQRVDGRADAVLSCAAAQLDAVFPDQQVIVRAGEIGVPAVDPLPVVRVFDLHRPPAVEHLVEVIDRVGGDMVDDEDRRVQVPR